MKNKLILIAAITIKLFSCRKKILPTSEIPLSVSVSNNSTFTEYVFNWHCYVSKWPDTWAFSRDTIRLRIGDSFQENEVYEYIQNSWANNYKVVNRGIGGATHATYFPYLDSCRKYGSKVSTIEWHLGTNEFLQNKVSELSTNFNRFYDSARKWFPSAQINVRSIEVSPKLRSRVAQIAEYNQLYKDKVAADVAIGNKASYIDSYSILSPHGVPDGLLFRSDSIHPNTAAYNALKTAIIESFNLLPTGLPVIAEPISPFPVKFNATATNTDGTRKYPRDWKYFPSLNANATGPVAPATWIKKFQWSFVSGPISVQLANPNAGNTKVFSPDPSGQFVFGEYLFKCEVIDNLNRVGVGYIRISIY